MYVCMCMYTYVFIFLELRGDVVQNVLQRTETKKFGEHKNKILNKL